MLIYTDIKILPTIIFLLTSHVKLAKLYIHFSCLYQSWLIDTSHLWIMTHLLS